MKAKTHSSLKKRISFTGTGKARAGKVAKRHLLSNKSKKAKGRNAYGMIIDSTHLRAIKQGLPNK